MPKSRSDKKPGKGTPRRGTPGSKTSKRGGGGMSDEESLCDTASVLSLNSDRGSYEDEGNGNIDDHDDSSSVIGMQSREALEEKIAEAIDGMTEKSANVRATCLATLITLLSQQFLPDLILGRRETLRDNLEKIFKRGQRSEQGLAATVYCLTVLQTGAIDIDLATEDFNAIKPCLQSILLDHTVPIPVRVKCCQALCFGAFLTESCLQDISNLLTILEPLFGAGVKGKKALASDDDVNGDADDIGSPTKSKIPKSSNCSLASAAIAGWSLLLTLMSREYLTSRVHRFTGNMQGLLDQAELEVRLNAGEALAILVELCELADDSEDTDQVESSDESVDAVANGDNGVSNGDNGVSNGHRNNGHSNGNGYSNGHSYANEGKTNMKALISKLRELSTESHKYRNKKDRRQQRHSFRDYLHAVEDGDGPGQAIKFGYGEVLEIDSWVKKRQYDAICQVLVSGINRHLLDNPFVRQVLELGAPRLNISDGTFGSKQAKNERQYLNACNFKARCVSRGKSRDHRMADLVDY